MLTIKSKARNKLEVEFDMRCAISITSPNINVLVTKKPPIEAYKLVMRIIKYFLFITYILCMLL